MIDTDTILQLQDVDLMRAEWADAGSRSRWRKLGFSDPDPIPLERVRDRLIGALERRWLNHYQRAQARYGRAITSVRGRVCQGCFITLPTCASPSVAETLTLCESCGRILYWR